MAAKSKLQGLLFSEKGRELPRADWVSIEELAEWWRVSTTTLRRELAEGRLSGFKLRGNVRISRREVNRYMRENTYRQANLLDAEF